MTVFLRGKFIFIFFHFAFPVILSAQRSTADVKVIEELLSKANKTFLLDSSVHYASAALQLADEAKNVYLKTKALYILGKCYNEKSDYKKAEQNLDMGLTLSEQRNDRIQAGLFYLEKGRSLQFRKEHTEALGKYLAAYKIFEELGNKLNLVSADVYLAEYYRNLGKFSDAEIYIHNAFSSGLDPAADKQLLILLNNRAAAIKSEIAQGDSSLYYSNIALKISKETGNLNSEAVSLNEIAFIYESLGRTEDAMNNYKKAEDIWYKAGYKRYWVNALENRARVCGKVGNYNKSNALLLQLIEVAKENNWSANLASAYNLLSVNYTQLRDLPASNNYKALGAQAEVEVFKKEHQKELEEIKAKYETEKNKDLLIKKQKEVEIANLGYKNQKRVKEMLLTGSLFLLVIMGVIIFIARQRTRMNKELKKKNILIEEMNNKLSVSLSRSELLMKEVHHRVKNNLQIISSMLHLQADAIENEELKNLLSESDNRILLMAFLHERLYSQNDVKNISVKDFISDVVSNIFLSYHSLSSSIDFKSEIEDIKVEMDKAVIIGIIVNELVTNSVKHAFDKKSNSKQILVKIFMLNEKVILEITDNGKGVPDGFSFEDSTSFGLNLVNIMVQQGDGKATVINENGTRIKIEL